ncbi:MAG: hypothetical protein ACOCQD_02820, partial [archaeon]
MEIVFVVPTMVSPQIPKKLVPAIAKLIERNIIINYAGPLRSAAIKRYSGVFSFPTKEDATGIIANDFASDILNEQKTQDPSAGPSGGRSSGKKGSVTGEVRKGIGDFAGGRGRELELYRERPPFVSPDQIEVPRGISFYHTIGLEPTYLQVPLETKGHVLGITSGAERIVKIGVKSIPFEIEGAESLLPILRTFKNMDVIQRYFFRKWNNIKKKIRLSKAREIFRGRKSGDLYRDIIFAPSSVELSSPRVLAKIMRQGKPATWSSISVLSSEEFGDRELKDILKDYRSLVESGWGDFIIVNPVKESLFYCSQRTMGCQEISFSYLKQVMNLD